MVKVLGARETHEPAVAVLGIAVVLVVGALQAGTQGQGGSGYQWGQSQITDDHNSTNNSCATLQLRKPPHGGRWGTVTTGVGVVYEYVQRRCHVQPAMWTEYRCHVLDHVQEAEATHEAHPHTS